MKIIAAIDALVTLTIQQCLKIVSMLTIWRRYAFRAEKRNLCGRKWVWSSVGWPAARRPGSQLAASGLLYLFGRARKGEIGAAPHQSAMRII